MEFRDGELIIDPLGPAGLLDLVMGVREKQTLVELFVVHEIVHVIQAINDKNTVESIRRNGRAGEGTLMHLDLSADHVAAVALERTSYPGELAWLKELQGMSLVAFPTGPQHSAGSRYRKAMRLASLRADYLAREAGLVQDKPESGYIFVDFSPSGGPLYVVANGPFMFVVASTDLDAAASERLADCAAPGVELATLDEMLGSAFAHDVRRKRAQSDRSAV